jgi:ataxia telangiectasia mutated family protein
MIQAELVDRAIVLDNLGSMLSSVSINGPTIFADSIAGLFQTIMVEFQREGTSSNGERIEQIMTWVFRAWAPSNFHDKMFASQHITIQVVDVMNLMNVCLGLPTEQEPSQNLPIWGSVAQSWIMYDQTRDFLDYLLFRRKSNAIKSQQDRAEQAPERSLSTNNTALTLLLGLCTTETKSAVEKWQNVKELNVGHLDRNMIRMVGVLVIVGLCLANCLKAKDTHRAEQLRVANEKLMLLMFRDLSNSGCEQDKVDAFLLPIDFWSVTQTRRLSKVMIIMFAWRNCQPHY